MVRMAAEQFILGKFEEQIELRFDGVGTGAAAESVDGVEFEVGGILLERSTVKRGRDAEAAMDPAFEDGALDGIGIDGPASQVSHVTVAEGAAGAVLVLLPMVEGKLHRKVFVKDFAAPGGIGFPVQQREEPVIVLADPADVQGHRIVLKFDAGNRPRWTVAERKNVGGWWVVQAGLGTEG